MKLYISQKQKEYLSTIRNTSYTVNEIPIYEVVKKLEVYSPPAKIVPVTPAIEKQKISGFFKKLYSSLLIFIGFKGEI